MIVVEVALAELKDVLEHSRIVTRKIGGEGRHRR